MSVSHAMLYSPELELCFVVFLLFVVTQIKDLVGLLSLFFGILQLINHNQKALCIR